MTKKEMKKIISFNLLTIIPKLVKLILVSGLVAQRLEHHSYKVGVDGPSPSTRTINLLCKFIIYYLSLIIILDEDGLSSISTHAMKIISSS